MTEPTPHDESRPADDARADESRDISDVGLPRPGDARPDAGALEADEAALDEVFPPEDA